MKASPRKTASKRAQAITATVASAALVQAASTTSAAARHAEELLDLVARRKARITEDFYEIGRALRELSKKKLYSALGYASFGDLLEARSVMGRTQAHKLISIVSSMSLNTALSLGVEKAFQLARYTKATPALDTPDALLQSSEPIGEKPAAKATARELAQAAIREKKKTAPARKDPAEKAAARAARLADAWLTKRGATKTEAQAVRRKDGWRVVIEMTPDAAEALFTK